MAAELGVPERVVVGGGWARNPAVLAEKRRQLGDFTVSRLREPGAVGAALLAGVAAEILERPASDPSPMWPARSHTPREREGSL
jgi:sugar (pentulose or hexulose) kinase